MLCMDVEASFLSISSRFRPCMDTSQSMTHLSTKGWNYDGRGRGEWHRGAGSDTLASHLMRMREVTGLCSVAVKATPTSLVS